MLLFPAVRFRWSFGPSFCCHAALLAFSLCLIPRPCQADTQRKPVDPSRIEAVIEGLRSPSFRTRLQAETDCRESGSEMLPALREALRSPDPELRRRAKLLIERIESDELTGSLSDFLVPGSKASLPGWFIIEDLVSDSPEIRAAYANILKGQADLSRALAHPELIAEEIQRELQNRNLLGTVPRTISPTNTSALLLLLVHPQAKYPTDVSEMASRIVWAGVSHTEIDINVLRHPASASADDKQRANLEILRTLVTLWVTRPDAGTPHDRLLTASRLALPEAVVPALEIIRQKETPHLISNAFVAIANYGGAEEMAIVESMLTDDFEISSSRKADSETATQVRDVALATLIEMTHQRPEDYDLRPFPRDSENRVSAFPVGFDSKDRREKSLEKWRAWTVQHLKKFREISRMAEEGTSL